MASGEASRCCLYAVAATVEWWGLPQYLELGRGSVGLGLV